jgi:putative transcriptional regulator
MKPKGIKITTGNLLIAEPFMQDPTFKRSVILLCEHTIEEGSIGFVLNKPINMNIDELVADFPEFESEVYYGGPVATDTIHFVHNVGNLLEDSVEVSRGIYWGGDFNKLKFLIESELIKSVNIRFFVGYSGWTSGQLNDELKYGSWVISDMHPNYLFKSKPSKLWKEVLHNKGENFSVIAQMPDSNSQN